MSTRSSWRNGIRLALIASTNSGSTPSAPAISRQRSASKPSTSPDVGLRNPNAITSNLTPQTSLPAERIASSVGPSVGRLATAAGLAAGLPAGLPAGLVAGLPAGAGEPAPAVPPVL